MSLRTIIETWITTSNPTSDDLKIAARIVKAEQARDAFFASDPRASQGFIRVDRVFASDPVALFGQTAPSLAHNRISIHRGMDDPDTGERVPGDAIFTALLSEASLTNLMMNQNRGETDVAMTTESANGVRLGPFTPDRAQYDDLFEDMLSRTSGQTSENISALITSISQAKLPLSAKASETLINTLRRVGNADDTVFVLERHLQNLANERVQYQVEAAHTAFHIGSVLGARESTLQLGAPEGPTPVDIARERVHNPILNALTCTFDDDECRVMAAAVRVSIAKICDKLAITYDPTGDMHGSRFKKDFLTRDETIKKQVVTLCILLNTCENTSVIERRSQTTPWQVTGVITSTQGEFSGLHSDFARVDSGYFRLSLATASEEVSFGNPKIRSGDEFLNLVLTSEDLMMALRGHPSGDFTRCTLLRCFGNAVPHEDYINRFDAVIKTDSDLSKGPEHDSVNACLAQIRASVSSGITTRAHRDALVKDLHDLRVAVNYFVASKHNKARHNAAEISEMVRTDLLEVIDQIRLSVPDVHRDHVASLGFGT